MEAEVRAVMDRTDQQELLTMVLTAASEVPEVRLVQVPLSLLVVLPAKTLQRERSKIHTHLDLLLCMELREAPVVQEVMAARAEME